MTQEAGLSILSSWLSIYMIVGTEAATLTGLMFVAITLATGVILLLFIGIRNA